MPRPNYPRSLLARFEFKVFDHHYITPCPRATTVEGKPARLSPTSLCNACIEAKSSVSGTTNLRHVAASLGYQCNISYAEFFRNGSRKQDIITQRLRSLSKLRDTHCTSLVSTSTPCQQASLSLRSLLSDLLRPEHSTVPWQGTMDSTMSHETSAAKRTGTLRTAVENYPPRPEGMSVSW